MKTEFTMEMDDQKYVIRRSEAVEKCIGVRESDGAVCGNFDTVDDVVRAIWDGSAQWHFVEPAATA